MTFAAVVLGSGQDAGVPQVGLDRRKVPERTASSLAVVSSSGDAVLFDVTPEVRRQQRRLLHRGDYSRRVGPVPFDAAFVTHAHMGHYAGLVHFGKEALGGSGMPVHGTAAMQRFLAANEPWASLFRDGHLVWSTMAAGEAVEPVAGLRVVAHGLPHRADFTDTVAFEIEAAATVLYAPDIDRWQEWPDAYEVIDRCDVALVDGTFFSDDELAHRDQAEVPHPAVVETIEVFRELATTTRIVLTHLNHTNPLCDPNAAEHQVVQEAGFEVAHDGMEVPL